MAQKAGARRLYTYSDPLDRLRLMPSALGGGDDGIVLEESGKPRHFVRQLPEFHDDPDDARLFSGSLAQPVVYPPNLILSLSEARLIGHRTLLTRGGDFCTDTSFSGEQAAAFLHRLGQSGDVDNEETGLRPTVGGHFKLDGRDRKQVHLAGRVVILASQEPYNFGSFLFRVLPKLHALRRFGLYDLPVLAHAHIPPLVELLALAGIDRRQLHVQDAKTLYTIDHAIAPSLRNAQAFLDPESLALFEGLRQRFGGRETGLKLYVSRLAHTQAGGSTRVMQNEAALAARLKTMGFQIVAPETLSVRDQIALFASADMMVGPSGSALFNTVFCRPGTKVIDIESEPDWIRAHTCLFASLGLRYAIFEGLADPADMRPVHRRWSVNIEALCARIAAFAAATTPSPRPGVLPPRRGSLDWVTTRDAGGWAEIEGSPDIAKIEILVDGRSAGCVRADQPRSDLRAIGNFAFSFKFPSGIAPGAIVFARYADTARELAHSPRPAQ